MKIKFDKNQKEIRKKLLEIINRAHVSHIGSCITAIDIIDAVYSIKNRQEKFIL